ncbi:MAG TPA: hypothetical protein VMS56_10535 [Thermoanaerobaculia bacterium]|nr:hypothetical protein [Thermoanaerobaculia bacterium]
MNSSSVLCAIACGAVVASAAFAQAPQPGDAISIPIPDLGRQTIEYQVVELAGARPADESLLVDGRLPAAFADLVSDLGSIHQKISLFENGLVSIELAGAGGRIRKRVIIPPDAVLAYREFFTPDDLADFRPVDSGEAGRDQVVMRIAAKDQPAVERKFRATIALPHRVERYRLVLQDLLRALAEDREVTNPITGYEPKIGDMLISDEQRAYELVRILQGGELLELRSTSEPVRRFVPRKDLHLYFIGVRPAVP